MKIAISTNDGIRMAPAFEISDGFLILTIEFGEIVEEDIRWKQGSGKVNVGEILSQISDCSVIVVREISESSMQFLRNKSIDVFRTTEEIITNVIVHYLEHQYREASDHCCCP
jgi:predicted Fe-Mo cluster-binding NifX family protein